MKFENKIVIIFIYFIIFYHNTYSQQVITIEINSRFQIIKGFGASDAWNCEYIGKYWNDSIKETIARLLFSKEFDNKKNPCGIGLSRWRFNVGAGSFEQGNFSNIDKPERRVECFLTEKGSYDWTKQIGQQYFLKKASDYGVEELIAFINSPPVFYTKNGRANSNNKERGGHTNLKDDCYDNYVNFITTILKYFEDKGIKFTQISPINEPQYEWNQGQEGCPWQNYEIKKLIYLLDSALLKNKLQTKILFPEAATYFDLYKVNENSSTSNQIQTFFDKNSKLYCGNLNSILKGMCCHSYFTDYDDTIIKEARIKSYETARKYGIELYQTEYSLLSRYFNSKFENSLFLAKMIYADLEYAGVSTWDFWTTLERERWNHLNRFYLIRIIPLEGDYGDLKKEGTIEIDKNLWILGNYSLFIRPGYQRIKLIGANDLTSLMGCSFISPDSKKIVVIFINYSENSKPISIKIKNHSNYIKIKSIEAYLTNSQLNLKFQNMIKNNIILPKKSVITLILKIN